MDLPKSRKEALKLGVKWYFTGKLCKNGHVDKRCVSNKTCYSCLKNSGKRAYSNNKEYRRQIDDKWRRIYPDKYREQSRIRTSRWRKRNPERVKEVVRSWDQRNRDKRNALNARYRASKLNATPLWLTEEHLTMIQDIYSKCKILSRTTGVPHCVDHIVPLRSTIVCGLHVPWNLQILTAEENNAKNNKLLI